MAKAADSRTQPAWRIIELAKKGRYLGTVRVPDANAAVKVAIGEFGISEPHRRKQLVGQRVG